ncbi:MAG: hypothetical protein OSA48_07055 [Akkermansiaceae bacterium]|jgi:hypothetical protein|nr:hypothetical protein [Akkermansiaceae bacterium]
MLRQDYLLREIERIVEFALRALGIKKAQQPDDFLRFLEENSTQLTGLKFDSLINTPSAKLVSLFYDEDGRSMGRLVASGALLAEAADMHRMGDEMDRARELFTRATEILAFATSQYEGDAGAAIAKHLASQHEKLPLFAFPPDAAAHLELLCNSSPPDTGQI